MRKAFFVVEQGLRGGVPAVFYEEIPTKDNRKQTFILEREIPSGTDNTRFFSAVDETPNFGELIKEYVCEDALGSRPTYHTVNANFITPDTD